MVLSFQVYMNPVAARRWRQDITLRKPMGKVTVHLLPYHESEPELHEGTQPLGCSEMKLKGMVSVCLSH